MSQGEYRAFEFEITPFDEERFRRELLQIVMNFFTTGVAVNDVLYTIGVQQELLIEVDSHEPINFDQHLFFDFFATILDEVSLEDYSLAMRYDLMHQVMKIVDREIPPETIFICTGSSKKYMELSEMTKEIFGKETTNIYAVNEEIQADIEQVVTAKVDIKMPETDIMLAEDTSMEFKALGGFPGVYFKDFLKKNSTLEIERILDRLGDMRATYKSALALKFFDKELQTFRILTLVMKSEGYWKYNAIVKSKIIDFNFYPKGRQRNILEIQKIGMRWLHFMYKINVYKLMLQKVEEKNINFNLSEDFLYDEPEELFPFVKLLAITNDSLSQGIDRRLREAFLAKIEQEERLSLPSNEEEESRFETSEDVLEELEVEPGESYIDISLIKKLLDETNEEDEELVAINLPFTLAQPAFIDDSHSESELDTSTDDDIAEMNSTAIVHKRLKEEKTEEEIEQDISNTRVLEIYNEIVKKEKIGLVGTKERENVEKQSQSVSTEPNLSQSVLEVEEEIIQPILKTDDNKNSKEKKKKKKNKREKIAKDG